MSAPGSWLSHPSGCIYLRGHFGALRVVGKFAAFVLSVIEFLDRATKDKVCNGTFLVTGHLIGIHRIGRKVDATCFLDELGRPQKSKRWVPTKALCLAAQAATRQGK